MAELHPWWVTGVVDGEGCFYASMSFRTKVSPSGGSHACVNLDAGLQVWMREDERPMLEEMKRFFGCGHLFSKPVSKNRRRRVSGANPACSFRINRISDLVSVVIPHFERFPLQSTKSEDFEVWSEIVRFVDGNLSGKKGWLRRFPGEVGKVVSMCDRLKETREFGRVVNHG